MRVHLVVGWAGVGKSYMANYHDIYHTGIKDGIVVVDWDSGVYKERTGTGDYNRWYENYLESMEKMIHGYMATGKVMDLVVLVSSHPEVIRWLLDSGKKIHIVRPLWHSKRRYLDVLEDRLVDDHRGGANYFAYIAYMSNFDKFYRDVTHLTNVYKGSINVINIDFRTPVRLMDHFWDIVNDQEFCNE